MNFFRPEAQAALWRWREVIAGGMLGGLGLWLISGPGFLLAVPGYAFLAGGVALVWMGVQRGRFRGPGDGAGAVQIDEGQVTYFGPLTGGTVSLREMDSLTLEGAMFPAHWRLAQAGQVPLLIPVNAAGADALFDAFATLPGLKTERMLGALRDNPRQAVVIWQRGPLRPEGALLH
jgi:hypothetical protein